MGVLLLVVLATFVSALLLTALLARPGWIIGSATAPAVLTPFVLAVWDPDGSCDSSAEDCDFLLLDFTPSDWFVLGLIGAAVLFTVWILGVGAGALVRSGLTNKAVGR